MKHFEQNPFGKVFYFAVQSDALYRSPAEAAVAVQYGLFLTARP
jgi:hypothetical protein